MQQPLYEIRDLVFEKKGQTLLSILKFDIHRGILYSIAGRPGSGKSILMEILAGLTRPSKGGFKYDGEELLDRASRNRFSDEVIFLGQHSSKTRGTVKRYMEKSIRTASWSTDTLDQRLQTITKQMNLLEKMDRSVNTLSPGERRWIDLAICVASDAKVLIIDELEQHVSYDDFELIRRQLMRKCNYEGTTVIISTLNPSATRKFATISITLDRGRIAMIRSSRDSGRGGRHQEGSPRSGGSRGGRTRGRNNGGRGDRSGRSSGSRAGSKPA